MTSPALGSETYPSYLDVDLEVMPWLRFNGIVPTEEFALNLIVDSVCTEAQRFIGRPIAATTYTPYDGTGKFDGSGGLNSGYIMLPKVPVISIQEIIEYQGDNPVELVEVDPSTGNTGGDGYQINYRTGRITRVLGGIWNRPFYPGSNNVWITWTAGLNPIPADIKRATLEWVAHIYRNTQQVTADRLGSGMTPAEQYEPATITQGLWIGVPDRVISTLKSYVRVGIR